MLMTLQSWWTSPRGRSSPRMMRRPAAGCSWMQLDAAGCSWMQLDAAGCSWMQLDMKNIEKLWIPTDRLRKTLQQSYLPGEPNCFAWPLWSSWWQFVSSDSECTNSMSQKKRVSVHEIFSCKCMLTFNLLISGRTSSNYDHLPWTMSYTFLHYFAVQRCKAFKRSYLARKGARKAQQDHPDGGLGKTWQDMARHGTTWQDGKTARLQRPLKGGHVNDYVAYKRGIVKRC